MKFKYFLWFLLPSLCLLCSRCANPVMPTGGIKDTMPPQIVVSHPANYSVNFKGKIIEITFNEFIKLDKISQQALISPPPEVNPEYRIKGKSLQVRFDELLKPETTYTIFFGNAIVDLTESNPLSAFTFVFSTGPVLDSMALSGNVTHAFDEIPAEGAFVFLYRMIEDTIPADSLPFLKKPYYVSRTDKNGQFRFSNLRNEPYLMYALEDKNTNFLYNKGGEAIAFLPSAVTPEYLKIERQQEKLSASDSLAVLAGAKVMSEQVFQRKRDSLLYVNRKIADSISFAQLKGHELRLFYEIDSTQKLMRAEVVKKGLMRFAFRYPAAEVRVEPMDSLPENLGLMRQYSFKKDTLFWFYRDSVRDSIRIAVQYDTLINDTLHLAMSPKLTLAEKRNQRKGTEKKGLAVSNNIVGRRIDIGQELVFGFPEPVIFYQMRDTNRFISNGDTVFNSLVFVKADSLGLKYKLAAPPFEPEGDYHVRIPDSVFVGLSGLSNDTIDLSFKIPALSDYGSLMMNIQTDVEAPILIQLLNPKGDLIEQRTINGNQKLVFERMKPAKFLMKAVVDVNNNGRWDTGELLKKREAERVYFFEKELEVRANWDLEEEWTIPPAKTTPDEKDIEEVEIQE